MKIMLKRIYAAPSPADGYRVLVDRLWPRGITRQDASISLWLKSIAPSPALRTWYGHTPDRWPDFRRRYLDELRSNDGEVRRICSELKEKQTITLLYAAKDELRNHAMVLREYLAKIMQ